jgi:hypothetical protein
MSLHKKAPLRQLSGQEQQELTQICRPRVTAAVEVIREDPPGRRPRCRLLNRCPLGRPPLQRRGLASHRPVQRWEHRRSDDTTPSRLHLITRPRCNDRGHPAFSFGVIDLVSWRLRNAFDSTGTRHRSLSGGPRRQSAAGEL